MHSSRPGCPDGFGTDDMLNCDRLVEYVRLSCRRDVFWLDTVGRSGLELLPGGFPEGSHVRRLHVVRPGVVGSTVADENIWTRELRSFVRTVETRTVAMSALGEWLTNDDFLLVDDRAVVRLVFDDHNRFLFARPAPELLDRYRFVRDAWWRTADRT